MHTNDDDDRWTAYRKSLIWFPDQLKKTEVDIFYDNQNLSYTIVGN